MSSAKKPYRSAARRVLLAALGAIAVSGLFAAGTLHSEYADLVLNDRAEANGVAPVIFPHWFHRIRFQCRVCHNELGFKMRAGSNDISMGEITQGKFCGACHNGEIAWDTENCALCHSGRSGLPTGVVGGHESGGPGMF